MSISEKQLAANRANAQKSTGPRTPEGKRISSRNALTHGVLAKALLIEGECEEGFLNLCEAYGREYNPQTPTEYALVHKAISAHWRTLRAASFESAALTHEILRQAESTASEDKTTRAMLAARVLSETSAHMERLSLYEHRLDIQHRHAIRDLLRLRKEHPAQRPPDPVAMTCACNPEAQGPPDAAAITCACNPEAQGPPDAGPETGVTHPSSRDSEAITCVHSEAQGPPAAAITCASQEAPNAEKMNLNKPTHFDEATKELIAPDPISKAIYDPPKAA